MSALWFDATYRVGESGDLSPHSKLNKPASAPPHSAPTGKINAKTQRGQGAKNIWCLPCVFAPLRLCVKSDVGKTDRRHVPPRSPVRLAAMGSGANHQINTGRDIQINFPFH
jgi:hypothetical protein